MAQKVEGFSLILLNTLRLIPKEPRLDFEGTNESTTMKVFLDVGSNRGQTVRVALEPKYEFDRIYCFEPVAELRRVLAAEFRDSRIIIGSRCIRASRRWPRHYPAY